MYQAVELHVSPSKCIRGVVRGPEGEGPFPGIIFFHGFTVDKVGMMRLHELFARACVEAGFVCIRFDFYGLGESDGDFSEMTIGGEIEEGKAIWHWAQAQPYIRKDQLFLSGHSMGGLVASIVAAQLAAEQAARVETSAKTSAKTTPAASSGVEAGPVGPAGPAGPAGLILWSPALTMYYQAGLRCRTMVGPTAGGWDIGGMELGRQFMEEAATMNFLQMAEGYQGRVLVLHGSEDEQIPVDVTGRYAYLYGEKCKTVIIQGANHQFSSIPWKQQIYKESIQFMKEIAGDRK